MNRLTKLGLLLALSICHPALAAPPTACPAGGMTAPGSCACTIGTSGTDICVAARTNAPWRLVTITNQDAANAVSCTEDGSTPAIGAVGSLDIPIAFTRTWGQTNVVFPGPFTCIGAGAGTKVTATAK